MSLNLSYLIHSKQNIKIEDFKDELNRKIAEKLYQEFEKENNNVNAILDTMSEEEQSHITEIMAEDYEITDLEKAIDDIMRSYQKEKLNDRKFEILEKLENEQLDETKKKEMESELSDIIISLAKMK